MPRRLIKSSVTDAGSSQHNCKSQRPNSQEDNVISFSFNRDITEQKGRRGKKCATHITRYKVTGKNRRSYFLSRALRTIFNTFGSPRRS